MGTAFDSITLIFVVAAVFVILRLRSVLGRRTGHERPPPKPFSQGEQHGTLSTKKDNVVPLPQRPDSPRGVEDKSHEGPPDVQEGSTLEQALTQIAIVDRNFEPEHFLTGAKAAYEQIVTAFAEGNLGALRGLTSDDVFVNFRSVIRDRESAAQKVEFDFERIENAEIVEAEFEDSIASLTVKFQSFICQAVRSRSGEVVSGDPSAARNVVDVWTFIRDLKSSDPNWRLAATDTEH